MVTTQRIDELLATIQSRGYWTSAEMMEAKEIAMGRDANYIPEGCEDWMQEDGVPRAYDRKAQTSRFAETVADALDRTRDLPLTPEERRGPIVAMGIREDEAEAILQMGRMATNPGPAFGAEERIKTLEATVTDLMRRLKALEERVV